MSLPSRIPAALVALTLAMGPVACRPKQVRRDAAAPSPSAVAAAAAAQVTAPERSGPPTLDPLSESQAQTVLPREMAAVTLGLPAMYKQVNALAATQGFEGWPEPRWPFEDDPASADLTDPFKELHPAIRLVWGNVNVLWIRIPERQRWDALILMRKTGTTEEAPWRLMWLKDAFGHPSLTAALPDTWGEGNTLDWNAQANLTYAKNLNDIQRAWAYSVRPAEMTFTCNQPESDAGLVLRYDADLGGGVQIVDVTAEEGDDANMGWTLTPKQFNDAKILRMGKDFVWVDIDGTKGVAPRADWDKWTVQFKNAPAKP